MALALLLTAQPTHHAAHHPHPAHFRNMHTPEMDQPSAARGPLPSISTLIEAANEAYENVSDRSPKDERASRLSVDFHGQQQSQDRHSVAGTPRSYPPPTPPLPPASSFDFTHQSPGNSSPTATSATTPSYYGYIPSSSNPELYVQRNSAYPPLPDNGTWAAQQSRPPIDPSLHDASRTASNAYTSAPNDVAPQYAGLSEQRPLPTNFPPPPPGQPPIDPQMAPTWQHHHYFPPSVSTGYTQSQDRYICPTCHKPFSRPSSLKIHTYSHTGEKPYKCKHGNCGKYFSVRSNMKRHEKGCHGDSGSAGGNSPSTA